MKALFLDRVVLVDHATGVLQSINVDISILLVSVFMYCCSCEYSNNAPLGASLRSCISRRVNETRTHMRGNTLQLFQNVFAIRWLWATNIVHSFLICWKCMTTLACSVRKFVSFLFQLVLSRFWEAWVTRSCASGSTVSVNIHGMKALMATGQGPR